MDLNHHASVAMSEIVSDLVNKSSGSMPHEKYNIFNRKGKLVSEFSENEKSAVISPAEVNFLLSNISNLANLEYEHLVIALIYLERAATSDSSGFVLCNLNWRSCFLICLMIASKLYSDSKVRNGEFALFFKCLNIERVNGLEIVLLSTILNYNVTVGEESYFDMHDKVQRQMLPFLKLQDETTATLSIKHKCVQSTRESASSMSSSFVDSYTDEPSVYPVIVQKLFSFFGLSQRSSRFSSKVHCSYLVTYQSDELMSRNTISYYGSHNRVEVTQ